ncbi:Molybdopterin oxidoreductase [Verrucomicrobia bacterium]|nr:Molybdopterin oxidoreductase [Verrucomicrobiota bacterium]
MNGLRQWTGPLTQDLVLKPGDFGLGQVPARLKPDATATTVCGFCSTGCGLNVHLRHGEAINLSAAPGHPVNFGMACPKGWEALTPLRATDRATTPLLRNARGELEPVSWEVALGVFVERFKTIQQEHGPDSLAWLGTGQITTEELAFLGALAKMGMGIRHGDGNTRQCMATAVSAYKQSFGFDAPPYSYTDLEESDVLIFIGSNLCVAHPILWQRVLRNRNRPQIIVIDPRKTETAMAATRHYAIRPKSDLILLYGLAHLLIANGWIDDGYISRHTTGFEDFKEFVTRFTPDAVAGETNLSLQQLQGLAEVIHAGQRVSLWWTMGINQGHEATRTAQAIINLALMTGNLGRPGTGANSITGQCNAMGSRLFSNTTNLLGGHDFENSAHREKVARILEMDVSRIPSQESWAYPRIIEEIDSGKIRGLWVVGTNPSHSWIDQQPLNRSLEQLDFLVVQDMFTSSETVQRADLLFPAAGWGEKEGSFINSERRLGHVKKVARAPGQALADFHIFQLLARAWGCEAMFRHWSSPEAVLQILKELSRDQPCDITGIADYADLSAAGGIQWPCPDKTRLRDAAGDRLESDSGLDGRRLFADGRFFHPDGKARFVFEAPRPLPEVPDANFPLLLLTGRGSAAQWHTGTRTEKSAVLRKLCPPAAYIEINPVDAKLLGIAPGACVCVSSRRGSVLCTAFVTSTISRGQVFIPMHYAVANQLTFPAFDPESAQPGYKACAVKVTPVV